MYIFDCIVVMALFCITSASDNDENVVRNNAIDMTLITFLMDRIYFTLSTVSIWIGIFLCSVFAMSARKVESTLAAVIFSNVASFLRELKAVFAQKKPNAGDEKNAKCTERRWAVCVA
ncbi:hypothetical protein [Insolitispirillum peregrinum]|uniref:hypothetical protein n=1 Tax=Insolitispirillum peregrinum TaxID=80876 RepID=UPI001115924C|nr:hypothetical protein [Insolitispirillum peregrinum]